METDRNSQGALQEFAERLRYLEEENRYLRESSHAFAQLAERLNATLQQELMKARGHRRQSHRLKTDRRFSTLRLAVDRSNDQD
jgi:uncharacterized protein (DUF2461 family)